MKAIVIYRSKYGATEQYAQMLAQQLGCEAVDVRHVTGLGQYDTILFCGGVYASGIGGVSFLRKNLPQLGGKRVAIFAVGASPYEEKAMDALKQRNLKGGLEDVPLFYGRGAWNEGSMSWKDRTMCRMLKKMVAKKDPSTYEPWEAALMSAGEKCSWISPDYITPLLEYCKQPN